MKGQAQGWAAAVGDWLAIHRPLPKPGLRLFCLPSAGAGASMFRDWRGHLPNSVELCLVQPPGRENRIRERAYTNCADLVAALDRALSPMLDRPYVLLGHSLGATVAYEWAQRIRHRSGEGPRGLVVVARAAPHAPIEFPRMHDLPTAEFKDRLRALSGTAEAVLENDELMDIVMPLLRADFKINDTYRHEPHPRLACPIAVYGGIGDTVIPEAALRAWKDLTRARFSLEMLPGNHFEVLRSPFLFRSLAELLRGWAAQGQCSDSNAPTSD